MASTTWQASASAPDFWMPNKLAWDGGSSRIGCEEWYDKGSETTEAEPEPVPYADIEARLPAESCPAESMLPAGLLEEIGTTAREEGSTKPAVWPAGGAAMHAPASAAMHAPASAAIHAPPSAAMHAPAGESRPVDVSTTVNMLSSVLGKHAALHYEADGRMISVTGGNDFTGEKLPPAAPNYVAPVPAPQPPGPPAPTAPPAPLVPPSTSWNDYVVQEAQPETGLSSEAYYHGYGYYPAMYGDGIQYQESMDAAYASQAQPNRQGAWAPNVPQTGTAAQCTPGRFCVFCGKPKHSITQRFCSHCGEMVVA